VHSAAIVLAACLIGLDPLPACLVDPASIPPLRRGRQWSPRSCLDHRQPARCPDTQTRFRSIVTTDFPKRDQWRKLPRDAPRGVYFDVLHAAVSEYYLADPSNPYQQNGRSSGAERWEQTRHCFVQALHRSGDFLDVGCANGLLLENLIAWSAEGGLALRPHGIDFVPELVELARKRFPANRDSFAVANAFYWVPSRQYDFVRTNLEYVPPNDWTVFIQRQYAAVAPGGRLIVCHYRGPDEPDVDPGLVVERAGFHVAGRIEPPTVDAVWIERPE
jgi:SAM-dependent methyltransferase